MKVYTGVGSRHLAEVGPTARKAEELGFDGVSFGEVSQDAFLPATLVAANTSRMTVGTGITLAFVRSPMATAYTAWGIQELANGRFELGLGSQVRGHNERRFSVKWTPPTPRMREVMTAIRAIWDCWQNGTPLSFSGNEYAFSLMPPEFNPGPLPGGPPKINLAGINPNMVRLAGEMADGFLPHGFNSDLYMHEEVLPNLEAGARRSGRSLKDLEIAGGGFIISGRNSEEVSKNYEAARRRISFYGSTRAYFPVWEVHGWQSTGDQLREMSFRNRWSEMPGLITDEMVDALCLITTHDELPAAIQKRYGDYATRINLEFPRDEEGEAVTKKIIAEVHAISVPT